MRVQSIWDAAADDVRRLGRFARNTTRRGRQEQQVVVQAVKATVAAVLAWAVASRLLGLPLPYVAPLAAMLMVSDTVYLSLLSGIRRVVAVALGVSLGLLVGSWAPARELTMALVLPVALLLGQWRRLGDQGLYAAFAALFMITFGSTEGSYALSRLAETGLGVLTGIVFNLVVVPPVRLSRLREQTSRTARATSELAADIAAGLRGEWTSDDVDEWTEWTEWLDDRTRKLHDALRQGRESLWFNPRRGRGRRQERLAAYERKGTRLRRTVRSFQTITDALTEATDRQGGAGLLLPEFTVRYASVLDTTADSLDHLDTGGATGDVTDLVNELERVVAKRYSSGQPGEEVAASLLVAARQLNQELTREQGT